MDGMINWGIFKRHFWGELLRHQRRWRCLLGADLIGVREGSLERGLKICFAADVTADVTDDPAKPGRGIAAGIDRLPWMICVIRFAALQ
jgi:hypothetical protein